jgi:7-keto-8-aminopelargonate synthetase-like enzyme
LCKHANGELRERHGIHIQLINYMAGAKGTERLRITPSPYHDDALIDAPAEALCGCGTTSALRCTPRRSPRSKGLTL